MKTIILLFMFCTIAILGMPSVFAQNITITEVSSNNFTGLPNTDFDGSFKVNNNASGARTIKLAYTGLSGLEIKFSPDELEIQSGSSQTISFEIDSEPEDESSYTGTFTATSGTDVATLNMSVNLTLPENFSMLEIKNVELGDKVIPNGGDISGFLPGRIVQLEFELKNNYPINNDPKLENFDIQAVIKNFADGGTDDLKLDFDESFKLAPKGGDRKLKSEEFRIPHDVGEFSKYELEIVIEAEDEEGRKHEAEFSANLTTKRDNFDAAFGKVEIKNKKVSCGEELEVEVEFANTGKKKFDKGYFKIVLQSLNVEQGSKFFELEADETETETLKLKIPDDAKTSFYTLTATAYDDVGEKSEEFHSFEIDLCDAKDVPKVNNTVKPKVNTTEKNDTGSIDTKQQPEKEEPKVNDTKESQVVQIDTIDEEPLDLAILGIVAGMILLVIILLSFLVHVYRK
jgi:hypothetical protein